MIFDGREPFVIGATTLPVQARSSEGMFGIRFRPGRAAPRAARTDDGVSRLKPALTHLAGPATELGYFDQSHLIADFREFAGATPVPVFIA